MSSQTRFGSLEHFEHGQLDVIDDDGRRYAFSNLFEVASAAPPYRKTAVAKNFEYVLEVLRAEGTSTWWETPHDEFALVMDGEVTIDLLAPYEQEVTAVAGGAAPREGEPPGRPMGTVIAKRGHMTLLPASRCYRLHAAKPAVVLLQTRAGSQTDFRWQEICDSASGTSS